MLTILNDDEIYNEKLRPRIILLENKKDLLTFVRKMTVQLKHVFKRIYFSRELEKPTDYWGFRCKPAQGQRATSFSESTLWLSLQIFIN